MARKPTALAVEPGYFDDPQRTDPEVRLWQYVLIQAIRDAKIRATQSEIRRWIETDDFITVCSFAGYDDHEALKAGIQKILAKPGKSVKPTG